MKWILEKSRKMERIKMGNKLIRVDIVIRQVKERGLRHALVRI